MGGYFFSTDGDRENRDQDNAIANAFLQWELSPTASVQLEYRYRNIEQGDLAQRFFAEDYYPGELSNTEINTGRIGGRLQLTPNSTLLASFTYQEYDTWLTDDQFYDDLYQVSESGLEYVVGTPNQHGSSSEIQHIFRGDNYSVTSGAGYFEVNGELLSGDLLTPANIFGAPPGLYFYPGYPLDVTTFHANAYSYWNLPAGDNLNVTVGLSYDSYTDVFTDKKENKFNPKLGIIYEPTANLTVRLAAFKAVKRNLVTNQTLQPTQIAGFNQFFDDYSLSEVETYGAGLDYEFSESLYLGAEYSERTLVIVGAGGRPDWEEATSKVYALWTPIDQLAFSLEYLFENFERGEEYGGVAFGASKAETRTVPLSISYFRSSGISLKIETIYTEEEGIFGGEDFGPFREASDDFWLVDASISHRLPKRRGFISVGARNLMDEEYEFYDQSPNTFSTIPLQRMGYLKFTLVLP